MNIRTSILVNKEIPLIAVEPESVFVLLEVKPVYEYDADNKPTDKIIGHKYITANTMSFEKYDIKVTGKKPLMTDEELQTKRANGERIYVEFTNAVVKAYWNKSLNGYADVIKADSVDLVINVE